MDGMLCDRCGEVATHFHEDYGNVCDRCAAYWTDKFRDAPEEDEQPRRCRYCRLNEGSCCECV